MALVSRVNKIKYPDEVIGKMLQLKNVQRAPVEETPEYLYNQKRNYERYLFVSNKYLDSGKKEEERNRKDKEFQDFDENGVLLDATSRLALEETIHTSRKNESSEGKIEGDVHPQSTYSEGRISDQP